MLYKILIDDRLPSIAEILNNPRCHYFVCNAQPPPIRTTSYPFTELDPTFSKDAAEPLAPTDFFLNTISTLKVKKSYSITIN
jgi:hypothetical protein